MKVYVVSQGMYAERMTLGIYVTLEAAMVSQPDEVFTKSSSSETEWHNGKDFGAFCDIEEHEVEGYSIVITPGDTTAKDLAFEEWLLSLDVEPKDTYRVECGPKEVIVWCYKRNQEGAKYIEDGEAAVHPPRAIPIEGLPGFITHPVDTA